MEPTAVVPPPTVARPFRLLPFRALRLGPRRVGEGGTARQLGRGSRATALAVWRERSQATQDQVAAVYLHEYAAHGLTVRGLVGALDVSRRAPQGPQSAVLPHEGIRPVQADDLADRMLELGVNPAPILLVHRADETTRAVIRRAAARRPDHEFDDRQDQHHRVWAVTDPGLLAELTDSLAQTTALIADGHHRYAAYLRMQRRRPGTTADRGLAMLVDQDDTPLFPGPIHRGLVGVSIDDLASAATATGHRLDVVAQDAAWSLLGSHRLVVTDSHRWAVLELHCRGSERSAVEVLHDEVLPALPRGPQSIDYLHTVDLALRGARRGRRLAVLMPSPDVDLVLEAARQGRLLPHKATSFQPKPSVGVLVRTLHDE